MLSILAPYVLGLETLLAPLVFLFSFMLLAAPKPKLSLKIGFVLLLLYIVLIPVAFFRWRSGDEAWIAYLPIMYLGFLFLLLLVSTLPTFLYPKPAARGGTFSGDPLL